MLDTVRLAVGTLTVLPVKPPATVDRSTWSRAIVMAPLVGLGLGAIAWVLGWAVHSASGSSLLSAVVVVAAMAALTRGLHLDGLADVADGLGSRRPAAEARAIMRRSDIGPFGVLALLLTVLVQVSALSIVFSTAASAPAAATVITSAATSRAVVTAACRRGMRSAPEGLAAQVVGAVPVAVAMATVAIVVACSTIAGALVDARLAVALGAAGLFACGASELWRRHCVRRLDAITGDVLGSIEQVSWSVYLATVVLVV